MRLYASRHSPMGSDSVGFGIDFDDLMFFSAVDK
jgi:hypothetical protein